MAIDPTVRRSRRSLLTTLLIVIALLPSVQPAAAGSVALPAGTHWIGVRSMTRGVTELYDRRTDRRFVPRGVNLLRAIPMPDGTIANRLLDPDVYDPDWVDRQLTGIAGLGYNTIRVFLDHCPNDCLVVADGTLNPAYLDMLTRFLGQARDHGLVVVLTENDVVGGPRYGGALPCCDPYGGYLNSLFLSDDGLDIARTFWRDLIGQLQVRSAPLEVVLAYSLQNEQFTQPDVPPLSLTSGLLTTGNGVTYDLSDPDEKIRMAEDNVIHWADRVADTIRALDPTTLVTMGFFAPADASVPASTLLTWTHLVRTKRFIHESNMDFYDLHAYPALDLTLAQVVDHFGIVGYQAKPLLMGEMGAFMIGYPTAATAADGLVAWQVDSCATGYDGWLTWSWGWDDPAIYNATDDNGIIAKALAPANRPNPCKSPSLPVNLALGRPVAVNGTFGDDVGPNAVDGLGWTLWNSGQGPPGTIQVDLGSGKTISEVRLLVSQDPAGLTTHLIQVRSAKATQFVTVATLSGTTTGEEWLRWFPNQPLKGVRWVRIVTTASPSWISWREVQIMS